MGFQMSEFAFQTWSYSTLYISQLSSWQAQPHLCPQPAWDQCGGVQVQHELRHLVPPHPGQHWQVQVRGERGGAHVRHGQRVWRPVGGGGAPGGPQDWGSSQQVSAAGWRVWGSVLFNCRYYLGEKMRINCTSAATLPPANLTWYINQKLVRWTYRLRHGNNSVPQYLDAYYHYIELTARVFLEERGGWIIQSELSL